LAVGTENAKCLVFGRHNIVQTDVELAKEQMHVDMPEEGRLLAQWL
jgi:hypothetical protein